MFNKNMSFIFWHSNILKWNTSQSTTSDAQVTKLWPMPNTEFINHHNLTMEPIPSDTGYMILNIRRSISISFVTYSLFGHILMSCHHGGVRDGREGQVWFGNITTFFTVHSLLYRSVWRWKLFRLLFFSLWRLLVPVSWRAEWLCIHVVYFK